ncbi:hypothetical protein O181_008916 [Austropuccinia psidii MF-1]|uniref:Uncharacterized protein n=1 Tax=Austropuccinia psidii MF-1 TaxID=1389203 RepID=A0A9Q3BNC6_9BASI|nr:hypothetical protein [Austropuccinia psidii MF-1]
MNKKSYRLSRWKVANTPNNTAYLLPEEETKIPIEAINITEIGTELFEEVIELYNEDKNFHSQISLLDKDCEDTALVNSLDGIWKASYYEGIFHLFDCIIQHRTKNTCVMKI